MEENAIQKPFKLVPGQSPETVLSFYLTKKKNGKYHYESMPRDRMAAGFDYLLERVKLETKKAFWNDKINRIFKNLTND